MTSLNSPEYLYERGNMVLSFPTNWSGIDGQYRKKLITFFKQEHQTLLSGEDYTVEIEVGENGGVDIYVPSSVYKDTAEAMEEFLKIFSHEQIMGAAGVQMPHRMKIYRDFLKYLAGGKNWKYSWPLTVMMAEGYLSKLMKWELHPYFHEVILWGTPEVRFYNGKAFRYISEPYTLMRHWNVNLYTKGLPLALYVHVTMNKVELKPEEIPLLASYWTKLTSEERIVGPLVGRSNIILSRYGAWIFFLTPTNEWVISIRRVRRNEATWKLAYLYRILGYQDPKKGRRSFIYLEADPLFDFVEISFRDFLGPIYHFFEVWREDEEVVKFDEETGGAIKALEDCLSYLFYSEGWQKWE